jgi:hypothetical protein
MNPAVVTISFMPDGTNLGGNLSNLQSTFNNNSGLKGWQNVILQAAQAWAQQTNLNFVVVPDNGAATGAGVDQEGDPEFGDIRIGGYNFGNSNIAYTYLPPSVNNYSIAGDITFNTGLTYSYTQTYDLFTVACHEFGHALGLADTGVANSAIVMYPTYVGKKTALATDDIQGIQSIYSNSGPRSPDVFKSTNVSFATAANINSYINQASQNALVPNMDITAAGQADFYTVNVPAGTTSTMKVQVQTAGLSLMAPKLTVYNANDAQVAYVSGTGQYGTTLSLSVSVTAGAQYFIKVQGADNTSMGTGRYSLGLSFNGTTPPAEAAPIIAYANGNPLHSGGGQLSQGGFSKAQTLATASVSSTSVDTSTSASTSTVTVVDTSSGIAVLDFLTTTTSTQTSTTS